MGTSAILHIVLLLFFLTATATPEPVAAGYVEVTFGDFSEGRPVQRATPSTVSEKPRPLPPAENETQPETQPDVETKPVDLPEQAPLPDEPEINDVETDDIEPDAVDQLPEPENQDLIAAAPAAAVAGQDDGDRGSETGEEGTGVDEVKAAPYVLEGINRIPLRTQLPDYDEKVNAIIQIFITVDPSGKVIGTRPIRRANGTLEQAAMQALRKWLFNPLDPNAPRENQTGTVTFRFRLE